MNQSDFAGSLERAESTIQRAMLAIDFHSALAVVADRLTNDCAIRSDPNESVQQHGRAGFFPHLSPHPPGPATDRAETPSLLGTRKSGRRGLNPRPSRWQRDVLPLNYSRVALQEQQLSRIAKARFVGNETFENRLEPERSSTVLELY
jgi:hypothetical protein